MKDQTLLRAALVFSVAGVLALWLISDNVVLEDSSIADLKNEQSTATVRISGSVAGITEKENIVIIDLMRPETTTVVLFGKHNLSLSRGENISVVGHVNDYNGQTELIADRVQKI